MSAKTSEAGRLADCNTSVDECAATMSEVERNLSNKEDVWFHGVDGSIIPEGIGLDEPATLAEVWEFTEPFVYEKEVYRLGQDSLVYDPPSELPIAMLSP